MESNKSPPTPTDESLFNKGFSIHLEKGKKRKTLSPKCVEFYRDHFGNFNPDTTSTLKIKKV